MTGTVFCGACGDRMGADAKFCASCGGRQETLPSTSPPLARRTPVSAAAAGPSTENLLIVSATAGVAAIFILLVAWGIGMSLFQILPMLALAGIAYGVWRAKTEGETMAQHVDISTGSSGKIRSYWVGFTFTLLTLGIYTLFWYYFVNDELKDIGSAKDDENLAQSSPTLSVVAISIGGWLILPPFLSLYNYGQRIKRAQRLGGVPQEQQINPTAAFLLYFPGLLLIVPYFVYFWYVTKHQNVALHANAQPTLDTAPSTTGAVA